MIMNNVEYVHSSIIEQSKLSGKVIWLFGLSGAGKSTIAAEMANILRDSGSTVFILDGDDLRGGLNSDLGFSDSDREENIRRAAEVAKLLAKANEYVICTFITPFTQTRSAIEAIMEDQDFSSIFIDTELSVCEKRDVKGLYKKARKGEIKDFTGISAPFESPKCPNIEIKTALQSVEESVEELFVKILPIIKYG
jgi:adenylylsulfate kinase